MDGTIPEYKSVRWVGVISSTRSEALIQSKLSPQVLAHAEFQILLQRGFAEQPDDVLLRTHVHRIPARVLVAEMVANRARAEYFPGPRRDGRAESSGYWR